MITDDKSRGSIFPPARMSATRLSLKRAGSFKSAASGAAPAPSATVFSIVNLFYFVSYTIISPVVGYLSDAYGIHNVMIMLAITAVILAAFTIAGALRVGKKTIRILK